VVIVGGFRLKSALVGEILDSGSSHSGRDSGRDVQYLAGHRHEFGTLTFKPLSGSGVKVFFFHLCDIPASRGNRENDGGNFVDEGSGFS